MQSSSNGGTENYMSAVDIRIVKKPPAYYWTVSESKGHCLSIVTIFSFFSPTWNEIINEFTGTFYVPYVSGYY